MKGNILIIDDHPKILKALEIMLEEDFDEIVTLKSPNNLISIVRSKTFDVILLDMNFAAGVHSGNEGIYWLREILKIDPDAIVIMITAYGDIDLAVKCIKEGALDFVLKPWDNEKLLATIRSGCILRNSKKTIEKLLVSQKHLKEQIVKSYSPIIGKSAAMIKVFKLIKKVSQTDANVIITGENGTGKDLIAHEIHRLSKRKNEIFLPVDLGAINERLFESEMFGHEKGAFTDAKTQRIGRFESASGGTLFLNEIANLSISMQAKLLTVLQNREIIRLGSNNSIPVDIRLITATSNNIDKLINDNLFRQDLYYRLNTIHINLPPLRERNNDIWLLAEYFTDLYCKKYEKSKATISSKSLEKLKSYSWPGNVRELQHTIEKAVILCDSKKLMPEDFLTNSPSVHSTIKRDIRTLADIEKNAIEHALKNNSGNIFKAAKELGLARQTLYNKMKKYDI